MYTHIKLSILTGSYWRKFQRNELQRTSRRLPAELDTPSSVSSPDDTCWARRQQCLAGDEHIVSSV